MSGKYKTCNQCGSKVDVNSNFCPHCKSESFRPMETIEDIKYKLLYWELDGGFVLSKTKFVSIALLLACIIDSFIQLNFSAIIGAFILAAIAFVIGFVCHKILGNDNLPDIVVKNNDNGLIDDIAHLLVYWQNKDTGEYVISKTKIITLIIVYIVALWYAFTSQDASLMGCAGAAAVLGIPAFIIGSLIHKFTNK